MPSYNKSILLGHLARDPETREFASGNTVTEMNVAVNRKYNDRDGNQQEEVAFVGVKAFGKTGEAVAKHFHKGKPILVEGRIAQDNWEDRETGAKRSKTYVVMERFEFVGDKRAADSPPAADKNGSATREPDDTLDEDVPF